MSRSYKKPFTTISKVWTKFKEHSLRQKVKQQLDEIRIDPDKDWEEYNRKKMGECGTRMGFKVEPGPEDTWYNVCQEAKRK